MNCLWVFDMMMGVFHNYIVIHQFEYKKQYTKCHKAGHKGLRLFQLAPQVGFLFSMKEMKNCPIRKNLSRTDWTFLNLFKKVLSLRGASLIIILTYIHNIPCVLSFCYSSPLYQEHKKGHKGHMDTKVFKWNKTQ